MRFTARIELIGVNPFVWLNPTQATRLAPGRRKPIPVVLRINGAPESGWKVNAMPTGDGCFRLYLNGIVRDASHTVVGDRVVVEVDPDPTYRGGPIHPIPPEFSAGLAASKAANVAWDALSPSRQKEILRYIAGLKGVEARRRNIQIALESLRGARRRFLGRDWNVPEASKPPKKNRKPTAGRSV